MPLRSNKEHDADDWVTMSFRVKHKDALLIHSAAEQAREHLSTASRMRKLVLEWVASELNIPVPDYSGSELNQEDITSAAKALGMTSREFMAHSARLIAASMREGARAAVPAPKAAERPHRPSSSSGLRQKVGGR